MEYGGIIIIPVFRFTPYGLRLRDIFALVPPYRRDTSYSLNLIVVTLTRIKVFHEVAEGKLVFIYSNELTALRRGNVNRETKRDHFGLKVGASIQQQQGIEKSGFYVR